MRKEAGLSQTEVADLMGISASYLSLLEAGRRSFSPDLRERFIRVLGVDATALATPSEARLAAELEDAMRSRALSGLEASGPEVAELTLRHPTFARAVVTLHRSLEGVTDTARALTERLADEADEAPIERARVPSEQIFDFFQREGNHFPELESAAERLWEEAELDLGDTYRGLVAYLEDRLGVLVRIVPAGSDPGVVRRYDPEQGVITLSEDLPTPTRAFQLAHVLGLITQRDSYDRLLSDALLTSDESRRQGRVVLSNYFAAAVVMPYAPFLQSARELRYDIDLLGHRFGASFEQVAQRLATMNRPGSEGVPFHFVRLDLAGNISKKYSGSGIAFPRFSGLCVRWNVHSAFLTPGMFRAGLSRTPDGEVYFCIARTVRRAIGGYHGFGAVHALGLGCRAIHAHELVYADGIDLSNDDAAEPIGVTCRICERLDCDQRAVPPLNESLRVSEYVRGLNGYIPPVEAAVPGSRRSLEIEQRGQRRRKKR